jgi:hypothetical protein
VRHAQRAALIRELDAIKTRLRRYGIEVAYTPEIHLTSSYSVTNYVADIKRRDEIEKLLTEGAP